MKNFYKILFFTVILFASLFSLQSTVLAAGPVDDFFSSVDKGLNYQCCLLKRSNDQTVACVKNHTVGGGSRIGCYENYSDPETVNARIQEMYYSGDTLYDFRTQNITKLENVDCNAIAACVEFSDQEKMFSGTISKSDFDLINVATFNVKVSKMLPVTDYNFSKLECINCNITPGLKATSGSFSISNSNLSVHELTMNFELTPYEYIKGSQDKKLPATVNLEFKASGKTSEGKDLTTFLKFPLIIKGANCKDFDNDEAKCSTNSGCLFVSATKKCGEVADASLCSVLNKNECAVSIACTQDANEKCVSNVSKAVDEYIAKDHQMPKGYSGPLPECAFDGSCRDVNKLVELALKVVDYLFSIVAGLAFVFFIYGGFTWIFSFGNPEKVKKGQQIFVYAVIGLIIVFSAYILVSFLLNVLGVNDAYIIIN